MDKKLKSLKICSNIWDIVVGISLIVIGILSMVGGFYADNAGAALGFALLAVILIPMFIAFMVYGLVKVIYGISNSIKLAHREEILTKKNGTIALLIFDIIFLIMSIFLIVAFLDVLSIERIVAAAMLLIAIILKIIFLAKLSKYNKTVLAELNKAPTADAATTPAVEENVEVQQPQQDPNDPMSPDTTMTV